jgi:hypothetical protein
LEDVGNRQASYLSRLVAQNADTDYGRTYGFSAIRGVEDYQRAVPVTSYEDYLPYIESISRGKQHVLTREPVLLFEPSSGTSSASKFIPYTKSLKAEFQRFLSATEPQIMEGETDEDPGRG